MSKALGCTQKRKTNNIQEKKKSIILIKFEQGEFFLPHFLK